ncbi:hypothetical protein NQ317_007434 [Molorchus minor]|uniref:C2H2-type domain-containing protein n=1 Tax=Molorchus minor TaxID=1323400 RepID=A0ABQ9JGX8_9CUCU|nr:hypothetical protein NQ317_007434 [Molorchus minor]
MLRSKKPRLYQKRPVIMRVPMKKSKQIESQQVGTRHQNGQNTISKNIAPKLEHKKFKCIKCENMFDTADLYRDHMKWHKCQKKFKCTKCSAGYNIENNLKVHVVLAHPEENNTKCPICNVNLTFQRAASMKSHLMLHQVEEYYTCEECSFEFDKESDFMKHIEGHVTEKKFSPKSLTCPHCKVTFEDSKDLRAHISDHVKLKKVFTRTKKSRKLGSRKERNHVCSVCKKSFIKNSLLERHERIHSGIKPFTCQYCGRGFTQKGTLQIHISRHTGVKPHSCTLCPAKFYQKGNLRVHIKKNSHVPQQQPKNCTCIFKKIATLNGHMTKIHLNAKDAPVSEEGLIDDIMIKLRALEQQTSGNLMEENPEELKEIKLPQKMTPENRLIEADLVDDGNVLKSNYVHLSESTVDGTVKKHIVRQKKIGDVRWYFCSYCSKQFKKPSDLIRHIRVHTKEKPFKCKHCKTAFSLKSTLISHMKTHKSNQQFTCKVCNNLFASLRLLNSHLRKHDVEALPKWQCITCGFLFSEQEEGLKHREEMGKEKLHIIQPFIDQILKQPLYQTTYGSLVLKPPKQRIPNTGLESPTVRPFHCSLCDARFAKRDNLKRHIQFHNEDRKFKCDLCPKTHIKKVHKKEVIPKINLAPNVLSETPSGDQTKTDFVPNQDVGITIDILQKDNILSQQDLPASSENIGIQQLPTNTPNSVQILNINAADPQQSNDYQTIYINLEEMPFLDGSNLCLNNSTMPSQIKLQNAESLLNQISDLQDNNIIFNIDSLKPNLNIPR